MPLRVPFNAHGRAGIHSRYSRRPSLGASIGACGIARAEQYVRRPSTMKQVQGAKWLPSGRNERGDAPRGTGFGSGTLLRRRVRRLLAVSPAAEIA